MVKHIDLITKKVIVVGGQKSQLIQELDGCVFDGETQSYQKQYKAIVKRVPAVIQLNIGGCDDFAKTDACILVYAIDDKESFNSIQDLYEEVRDKSDPIYFLVANKADKERERQVSKAEEDGLRTDLQIKNFVELDANKPTQVNDLFEQVKRTLVEVEEKRSDNAQR